MNYTSDVARYQMADKMRQAEAYRLAKEARAGRRSQSRGSVRRVAANALSLLLWPVKH
jgi:hypothetical protein